MNPLRRLRQLIRALGYDIARFPRETLQLHLEVVLQTMRVNCVLDVGAHHGEYAHLLRKIGFTERIVSFEPVSSNFQILQENTRGDPNWTAHKLALGAEDSTMEINVSRETVFSSFRRMSADSLQKLEGSKTEATESVPVRRLDGIFSDLVGVPSPRVFLKIDTQGWDIEVLKGADGCLSEIVGLQSEVAVRPNYEGAPSYLEAIPYMNGLGFDLSGVFLVSRDADLRLAELDCVLIRPGESGQDTRA